MLMMRLKAENSVCGLLQVFVMHYAKENVHQVPNQTDLQQKKSPSFGGYLMVDFTNLFL